MIELRIGLWPATQGPHLGCSHQQEVSKEGTASSLEYLMVTIGMVTPLKEPASLAFFL